MYKIKIDTSVRFEKKVELYKENELLAKKEGDFDIVSGIKELVESYAISLENIDLVEPNKGPGSFTGLKVGVTIANVINWANGAKRIDELDLPEYGAEPNISPKQL